MKKRPSGKEKARRRQQEQRRDQAANLRALERLQRARTLFEPATRPVIHAALDRAGLDGGKGPVVEIGSGGGQLRRWLPAPLLPVMVHTEREPEFLRRFKQAVPEATVQVASAEALPYANGSVAGVLGLCVLDVVGMEAVAREIQRVLKPGGSTIQLWDMAPNMTWLCARERREGQVLLPDCFSDPLVRAELPAGLQAELPPLDFLQDLVSVPVAHLQGLIALLRPGPSALIDGASLERLARYVALFAVPVAEPSDAASAAASAAAARALAALCEDEREGYACKRLLLNAWTMLRQARGGDRLPLDLRRVSSAQSLSERLTDVFTATGMQVECDVGRARALVPRPLVQEDDRLRRSRFVGRWVGATAYSAAVPPAGPTVIGRDVVAGRDDLVVEAGVLVMVARKPA